MRLLVDLPETQVRALKGLAKTTHLPRAELIRRAIAQYLTQHTPSKKEVFGLWKGRNIDALVYEDKLRGEWKT
jgi:hypothetical protein